MKTSRVAAAVHVVVVLAILFFLAACQTGGAIAVQQDFRLATAKVLPAVVKIDVLEVAKDNAPSSDSQPFFDYFFDNPDGQRQDRPYQQESLGSGIIVRRAGSTVYAVTNAHVIADAQDIKVTLDDGRAFPATLVGKDERKDVALIAFEAGSQAVAVALLADSAKLQVGDWVLAMGAPYGFQSSVTAGIVSALHRRGGPAGNINDFIQTDAAINKGNSGGALVDINGQVVGVNTWITSQTGDSVGLGFSIPINNIKEAINDFIAVGHIRYGWLGVSINNLDGDLAGSLGITVDKGALIASIYRGSPADLAGLLPGDVVIALGKQVIPDGDELIQGVGELEIGRQLDATVLRGKEKLILKLDIVARLPEAELAKQSASLWPGLALYPLTDQVKQEMTLDSGAQGLIIRQVIAQSPAQQCGLKTRDVVTKVNGQNMDSLETFYSLLNRLDRGQALELVIIRDGKELNIVLKSDQEGLSPS